MRIIVADDQEETVEALAELIRMALPCEVVAVRDGEAAWQAALQQRPDAILLDLFMPRLSGLEVAKRVRAHYGLRRPCLVALTGRPDAARLLPHINEHFDRVFVKPVDDVQLLAALAQGLTAPAKGPEIFDVAELFTRIARQVLPAALARRLAFSFDYLGPAASVEGDPVAIECALHRLMLGTVDMLADGFVMFTATATLDDAGTYLLAVESAGTGTPHPPAEIGAVIERLRLVEVLGGPVPGARAARSAAGMCPTTGAQVRFSSDAYEGVMLRAEFLFAKALPTAAPAWPQAPATAWLVEAGQRNSGRLPRRLQRHGWQVSSFAGLDKALAKTAVLAATAEPAWPALLIVIDAPEMDGAQAATLRRALPQATRAILAVMAGSSLWATPQPALPYDVRIHPFSPADLGGFAQTGAGQEAAASPAPAHSAPARTLVLLVDDNEVNRIIGRGLVEALGYEVETANDGLDAIDHCRHSPPHILLMDLDMPIMGGLAATRHLRALQRTGEVAPFAIVAATADASDEAREACRLAGMDAYMSKPLNLEELHAQLRRFTLPR